MTSIADLRKSYERAELDESASNADPLKQFELWFQQALDAQLPEPNAMTLATVGEGGRPSTRVVLIKGLDARGIVWYTNYQSRKGRELAKNPFAAIQFHWVDLERVVRIEGRVEMISAEESDTYFQSRPLDSRLGAWASPQSEVISSRAVLVTQAAKVGAQFLLSPPRPPHWGGYRLVPDAWEFWQGRKSRLHDRLRYRWAPSPTAATAAVVNSHAADHAVVNSHSATDAVVNSHAAVGADVNSRTATGAAASSDTAAAPAGHWVRERLAP